MEPLVSLREVWCIVVVVVLSAWVPASYYLGVWWGWGVMGWGLEIRYRVWVRYSCRGCRIKLSVCALFHSHNFNCALFQYHQIELCLVPMAPNWIVPYSNTIKLKCALFQWPQIILCLIPMSSNRIVPKSNSPDTKFVQYFQILSNLPIFSYLNNGIEHKFNLTTMELGTI